MNKIRKGKRVTDLSLKLFIENANMFSKTHVNAL